MTRRSRRRSSAKRPTASRSHKRNVDYSSLKNPLIRQPAFSEDRLEAIHQTAMRVVGELGIKVLNEEARGLFNQAGATVDNDTFMVKIDKSLIEQALKSAPSEFVIHGAIADKNVVLGGDNIAFVSVGWVYMAAIALCSVIAFVFSLSAIRKVGASTFALFLNVEPVVILLLARLVIGEDLTLARISGMTLVVIALVLSHWRNPVISR